MDVICCPVCRAGQYNLAAGVCRRGPYLWRSRPTSRATRWSRQEGRAVGQSIVHFRNPRSMEHHDDHKASLARRARPSEPVRAGLAQADLTGTGGGPLSTVTAPNTTAGGVTKPPSRDASPTWRDNPDRRTRQSVRMRHRKRDLHRLWAAIADGDNGRSRRRTPAVARRALVMRRSSASISSPAP